MEFLKQHYEKVVLGVVLLALAGVAIWLPMKINQDKAGVDAILQRTEVPPNVKPLPPVDLARVEQIREQAKKPPEAEFAGEHKVFNSGRWIKTPDGALEKVDEENTGARRVVVEAVKPLQFTVKFDRLAGSGYNFVVTREAADTVMGRRPKTLYASTQSQKNEAFTLLKVNGPEDDPLTFELQINDTAENIVVSRNNAYTATNGYAADLSYALEKKTWKDARVKQPLVFAGDTNIVVDINPREVILRAVSNEKTTTIPFNAVLP